MEQQDCKETLNGRGPLTEQINRTIDGGAAEIRSETFSQPGGKRRSAIYLQSWADLTLEHVLNAPSWLETFGGVGVPPGAVCHENAVYFRHDLVAQLALQMLRRGDSRETVMATIEAAYAAEMKMAAGLILTGDHVPQKLKFLSEGVELFASVLDVLGLRYGEDKVWAEDPDSLAESVGLAGYLNEKLENISSGTAEPETARSEIGQLPTDGIDMEAPSVSRWLSYAGGPWHGVSVAEHKAWFDKYVKERGCRPWSFQQFTRHFKEALPKGYTIERRSTGSIVIREGADAIPKSPTTGEYAPIEVLAKENAELREQLAAVDGRCKRVLDNLPAIMLEVFDERRRQDEQWGGPKHDDRHEATDWYDFILRQIKRIHVPGKFRLTMIKVAALAVAAIESYDRKTKRRFTELEAIAAGAELSMEPTRVVLFPGLASWLKAYEAELRNDLAGDVGVLAGGLITVPLRRLHDGYLDSFETPPKGSIAELSCFRQAVQMAGYVTKPGAQGAEVVFGEKPNASFFSPDPSCKKSAGTADGAEPESEAGSPRVRSNDYAAGQEG